MPFDKLQLIADCLMASDDTRHVNTRVAALGNVIVAILLDSASDLTDAHRGLDCVVAAARAAINMLPPPAVQAPPPTVLLPGSADDHVVAACNGSLMMMQPHRLDADWAGSQS